MNQPSNPGPVQPPASRRDALLLALIAFVLGIVLAGAWFHHHLQSAAKKNAVSSATKDLVSDLAAPVTVQYYAILPADSADETLQNFSGRVGQLLENLKSDSHGKLQITTINTPSETNDAAADAAGIQAFNHNKGNACYLGLVVTSGKASQIFARLQPKWEPALQFDLARAISRVATENAPVTAATPADQPGPETIATVQRLIPDLKTVTPQQGAEILHQQFLKDCSELGKQTEAKLKQAQQAVVQAQASGSPADVEAARKNLLQVQLDGANQLKKLAAQLQTQLAAFNQMKEKADNAAK